MALQSLYLLNSPQMLIISKRFADRVRDVAEHESQYAQTALNMALGREADVQEGQKISEFLDHGSLEALCQSLLNLNEFVYLP